MSSKILWSANDPGGANAVIPVAQALVARGDTVAGVATGPALAIAKAKGLAVYDTPPFAPDLFLAGTSIGDSVDEGIFRTLGSTPTVYVMDFWGNYKSRFTKDGIDLNYLPTKVCVIDEQSKKDAMAEEIPEDRLEVTGNPHFDHFVDGITRTAEDKRLVVFASQPIIDDVGHAYGFDEYAALEDLIALLPQEHYVEIRLHPRDKAGKYDKYLGERVRIAGGTLEESLSRSGLVVGMTSAILFQAAAAGKLVLSYQPHGTMDNLVTNTLGLTHKASTREELAQALAEYVAGSYKNPGDVAALLPKGATERVIAVIDSLL